MTVTVIFRKYAPMLRNVPFTAYASSGSPDRMMMRNCEPSEGAKISCRSDPALRIRFRLISWPCRKMDDSFFRCNLISSMTVRAVMTACAMSSFRREAEEEDCSTVVTARMTTASKAAVAATSIRVAPRCERKGRIASTSGRFRFVFLLFITIA